MIKILIGTVVISAGNIFVSFLAVEDWHATINSMAVVVSLLGILWLAAVKMTKLEVKVDTLWKFLIERAIVEGVNKGFVTVNSPVRLEPHSSEILVHMVDELTAFGQANSSLRESDLMLAIQREFGARLVREVCIPNNISLGTCLLIATAVAKGEHTLTEILDEYQVPQRKPQIET